MLQYPNTGRSEINVHSPCTAHQAGFSALPALLVVLIGIHFAGCTVYHRGADMKYFRNFPEITEDHYRVYDGKGQASDLDKITDAAGAADVLFVGETHNDSAAHFLEAVILNRLCRQFSHRPPVLSLEMFEKDVQVVLDEYLSGLISERHFLTDARAWPNYSRAYAPLIEFARENNIPVLAANAPRRYVNRVARLGPDALNDLSASAKSWLPPLPFPNASPEYRKKLEALTASDHRERQNAEKDRMQMPKYLTEAQSLWDAAMAYSLAEELRRSPGALILNVNGKFHSDQGMGIPEHLLHYRPGTDILTISILPEECFPNFDEKFTDFGDFVIVTSPHIR